MASTPHRVAIPKNGVDYRGKIVLAPMVRSGELPSRLLALKYGADLVWGPETVDRAMIGTTCRRNARASTLEFTRIPSNRLKQLDQEHQPQESVIFRISEQRESAQLIFQIGTADPSLAVQAATLVAPYVAGVDVNAGCPKPFSTDGGMGAALLTEPDRLCAILTALVEQVGQRYEIGISVKIRLLADEDATKSLVERLCGTGITGLTVHCRTRAMRKHQRAIRDQLRMVADTCRSAGVACLMNGDVESREEAESLVQEYNVDGAMIASAAEKNSSVFRSARAGGTAPWEEVVAAYMEEAIAVENRWGNTKFLLGQLMPGKEQTSRGLSQAKNYEHACRILELDHLLEDARALDECCGLTHRETRKEQKAKAKEKCPAAKATAQQQYLETTDKSGRKGLQHRSDYHMDLHKDIVAPAIPA